MSFVGCLRGSSGGFGLAPGPLEDICEATRPVEDMTLHPAGSSDGWMVVAEVTLLEEGRFEMSGYFVKYRDGMRRGRDVTGIHLSLYTPGHEPDR